MERAEFQKRVLDEALRRGCEAAEVFFGASKSFEAGALHGALEQYSVSRTAGLSVRVQVKGNDGYAYTERFDDPALLVKKAMEGAACLSGGDPHPMQVSQTYAAVASADSPLLGKTEAENIALALELERLTLAADPRVVRVAAANVETSAGEIGIYNTLGLAAAREKRFACCYVEPVVEEAGEVQTGFAFRMGANAADVAGCAKEAVEDALSRLGGKPVPSGTYRVLIKNLAMADLLRAFSAMFSAEQAQKGCSLLAGKEGERIAADCVTLVDDPFDPVSPRPFDGEGTPCKRKQLIEGGKLVTLLHNLKTAKKAGCVSTGNAVRASAAATVGVGPTVLRLEPGRDGFGALMDQLGRGLLITDLQGLHAGLNPVSGDFSLKATGRLVENGKDVRAVSGITVAGNFLDLMRGVLAVGSDAAFNVPSGCYTSSPSVLVAALTVAGT